MDAQYWWLIIGVLLIIVEIFTPGFFAASMGIGAFAAALAAFLHASLTIQLIVFSIVSVVAIFGLRPFIVRYLYAANEVKTNADALLGKMGTVTSAPDATTELGRMRVDGDEWQYTLAGGVGEVKVGQKVRIVARDSIILTVEPLN